MPYSNPGRSVTKDELESQGLVAPPEVFTLPPAHASPGRPKTGHARWPDYGRSLMTARRKTDGTPDRSNADFRWCLTCLDPEWGGEWSAQEVVR